ncbi:alpha/beta-hydrolase [Pluteus cervinus]|uniref:Alpha/beta-hydrolase n=1 Tax=Pluteus cervinus TaxID=181527 RepID=A0ACD3AGG7_9AGAR|nr:alpha/beta-hydrolase [Pluteus cervinus]
MSPQGDNLPTIFDTATCVRKGLFNVSKHRKESPELLESHALYYEQHGKGTKFKVFFIMGLNTNCFGWEQQVKHFGKSDEHTVIVFDNRGVGNSGYPRGPYSTSGMAEDAIALLDYIGWTAERDIHVVGISLGGMIAQELVHRISDRIASLTLAVTTPGGWFFNNFPPWTGVWYLSRLMFTSKIEAKVPLALELVFPQRWLEEKAENDPHGRTNRQVQTEGYLRRMAMARPQQFLGHISQMAAGLTHYVSKERLQHIGRSIPKITIVTGDHDNLILPQHSKDIAACIPQAEFVEWEGTGHSIIHQRPVWFNTLVEKTIREGAERCKTL